MGPLQAVTQGWHGQHVDREVQAPGNTLCLMSTSASLAQPCLLLKALNQLIRHSYRSNVLTMLKGLLCGCQPRTFGWFPESQRLKLFCLTKASQNCDTSAVLCSQRTCAHRWLAAPPALPIQAVQADVATPQGARGVVAGAPQVGRGLPAVVAQLTCARLCCRPGHLLIALAGLPLPLELQRSEETCQP